MELEKEAVAEMQDSPNPGKNAGGV